MWYAGAVEALFEATATGRTMAKGRSLSQFQEAFPDEASCAAFLSERRWPEGFVCPGCGEQRAAALKSRAIRHRFPVAIANGPSELAAGRRQRAAWQFTCFEGMARSSRG